MYTLFEVLTGKIIDSKYIYHESTLHRSIIYHLNILLNTRQGSLLHLPHYGLPDLYVIYQGLPNSISLFSKILCNIIEQYEPRLTNVNVQYKPVVQNECIIHFEISANLQQEQRIFFDTYFMSGGKAIIETVENNG